MGECDYYLVAIFDDKETAREAAEILKEYVLPEMKRCYECWQEIRHHTELPASKRYEILKKKFDILRYLGLDMLECSDKDINMNFLAGKLSIGDSWSVEVLETLEEYLVAVCSYDIWHFADWTYLARLVKKLGAKKVYWTNEEELSYVLERLLAFTVSAMDNIKDSRIRNALYEVDGEHDNRLKNELKLRISLK